MDEIKFALFYDVESGEVREGSYKEFEVLQNILTAYKEIPIGYGGMIVFSTDVNSNAKKGLKNKIKSIVQTYWNRLTRNKKIDEIIKHSLNQKGISTGWSIGNFFRGRYFDQKNGKLFNEKSLCVDLRGADFKFVKDIANKIRRLFNQQSVLVVNHKTGMSSLIEG